MAYVLITGATSGIGYELSKVFYVKGWSLILVGRSEEKLVKIKKNLEGLRRTGQPQEIICICEDLSNEKAAVRIYMKVKAAKAVVKILINNAGAGYVGPFIEEQVSQITNHIQLNIAALTLLTRYFVEEMKQCGGGKILNVASTGSYCPGAYTAVYYATKAYVLSLSEALYEELKSEGIHVASLCPGATKTNFSLAAGRKDSKLGMNPEFVAQKAYMGLLKNKKIIVPGIRNKLMIRIPKIIAIQLVKSYQKRLLCQKVT